MDINKKKKLRKMIFTSSLQKCVVQWALTACLLAAGLGLPEGCKQAEIPTMTHPVTETQQVSHEDHVTITYFYSPKLTPAIHLATEWVVVTIEDSYGEMIRSGRMSFVGANVDNPEGDTLRKDYHASAPAIFITRTTDGVESRTELKAIWLYLDESLENEGLKAQFISLLKKDIDNALGLPPAGNTSGPPSPQNSAAPTIVPPREEGITSLSVAVSLASGAEYLDIAVSAADSNGKLIPFKGSLTVRLWDRPSFFDESKGELLQEWLDIPVEKSDFVESLGAMLSLPYHDFMPASASIGYLQVILRDGDKTISSAETPVQVRRALGC